MQALKSNVFTDKALFSKQMCEEEPRAPGDPIETKIPAPGTECETIEIEYDCSDRITAQVGSNLVRQEPTGVAITIYEEDDNRRLSKAKHLADPSFKKNIWSQIVNTKTMTFNLKQLGQMLGKSGNYALQFRADEVKDSSVPEKTGDLTDSDKGNLGSLKNAIRLKVDENLKASLQTGKTELIYSVKSDIDPEEKENCDRMHSPLMVNINGGPITLSPPTAGTHFDINGDGKLDRISWPTESSVMFLVHDRNKNGRIENVHELFGDNTQFSGGKTYANGFEALRTLDSNGDGVVDGQDSRFGELQLWSPVAQKLHRLSDLGVASIDLNYVNISEKDPYQNQSKQRSLLKLHSGQQIKIFDVYFRVIPSS